MNSEIYGNTNAPTVATHNIATRTMPPLHTANHARKRPFMPSVFVSRKASEPTINAATLNASPGGKQINSVNGNGINPAHNARTASSERRKPVRALRLNEEIGTNSGAIFNKKFKERVHYRKVQAAVELPPEIQSGR